MGNEDSAVLDTVTGFLDSYAKRDVDGCLATMSASRPILLLGSNEKKSSGASGMSARPWIGTSPA